MRALGPEKPCSNSCRMVPVMKIESPAGTLGLVVVRLIPFELAHELGQVLLPTSSDVFLQHPRRTKPRQVV